jgi:hypothetical protein
MEAIRWASLRSVGNSPLVRASALVPVLGYLVLFNEHIAGQQTILGEFQLSWRLMLLYLGLSLVGIGSMIYVVRCPETIKRYSSAVDYALAEGQYFGTGNNLQFLRSSVQAEMAKKPKLAQKVHGLTDPDITASGGEQRHLLALMSARWHIRNADRLIARSFVWLFYGTGFLLAAVPTVSTFVQIARGATKLWF